MDRRHLFNALALGAIALGARTAEAAAEDEDAVRDIALRFAASLTAHDMTAFAALFDEGYEQHQTVVGAPPPPAGREAKEATLRFFAARLAALPDLKVTADPIVAGGAMLAAQFTYSGTHRGTYLGVAPTARYVTFTSTDIFRVRDGRIAAHWGTGDVCGLLQQLRS